MNPLIFFKGLFKVFGKFFAIIGKVIWFLFLKFRISMILITIVFILIQAIMASINAQSIQPLFETLMNEFLFAIENVNNASIAIVSKGSVGTGEFFRLGWDLVRPIIVIYMWIKVLFFLFLYIVKDESKKIVAYELSIFFFLLLTSALIMIKAGIEAGSITGAFGGLALWKNMFVNLFRALGILLTPIGKLLDKFNIGNKVS